MKNERATMSLKCDVFALMEDDDNEKTELQRVKLTALSGDVISHPYWGRLRFELGGMTHKEKIPINYLHDDGKILGFVDSFATENNKLILTGAIVRGADDDGDKVLKLMAAGVPYEASIEWHSTAADDTQILTETVNGVELRRVVKWPLKAVAIVPLGADGGTKTELMSIQKQNEREQDMSEARKEFAAFVERFGREFGIGYWERGLTLEQSAEEHLKAVTAKHDELSKELAAVKAELDAVKSENEKIKAEAEKAMSAQKGASGVPFNPQAEQIAETDIFKKLKITREAAEKYCKDNRISLNEYQKRLEVYAGII